MTLHEVIPQGFAVPGRSDARLVSLTGPEGRSQKFGRTEKMRNFSIDLN